MSAESDSRPEAGRAEATVVVGREDVTVVRAAAGQLGVRITEANPIGFEPVTTVTLLLLGSAAAVAGVQQVVDELRGGQILDLREGAPRLVYRDRGLKYGLVVVRTGDGEVRVEVHEPRGALGQVLDALASVAAEVGKAGAEAFSAAARDAVSGSASISIAVSGGGEPGKGKP